MSISARTNDPAKGGAFSTYQLGTYESYKSDGSLAYGGTSNQRIVDHYCSRSPNQQGVLREVEGRSIRLPTNFSRYVSESNPGRSKWSYTYNDGRRTVYDYPWACPWSTIDVLCPHISGYVVVSNEDAINHSITKAMNYLGDQKVQIGTALAEARKTYDLIADSSFTLWRSYLDAKKGRWSAVRRRLGLSKREMGSGKTFAQNYLKYRYGIMPTLRDLKSGYDWFMDDRCTPMLLTAWGSATRTWGGGNSSLAIETNQKARTVITASVEVERSRFLNQAGLVNPAQILWEVVPFSFVVDWYMPIGNILQTYTDSKGLSFVSGYTSTRNEAKATHGVSVDEQRYSYRYFEDTWGEVNYFSFTRHALGGFPRPGVYAKQNWFNQSKGLAALALFRQALR